MPAHLLPCFPLSGKKVFLHLIRSDQLTRILSRLGVDVRPFFDRSVEVVIYNPEARQSPTSTQCVQPASSLPPLSRGRAMVMAANQGTTPRQHDVISQARTLGIRLIALEEIRGWIRELPENVLRAISGNDEEPSSEYFDPDIDRRFEVRPLQGSAVKVTDRRNPFRPLYAENTNFVRGLWPCIRELIPSNPSCPTDPAAGPSRPVSGSERIPRPLTFTTQISGQSRRTAVPSTLTQPPIAATICQTTAATRIVPSGSRQAESPAATGHTGSEKRLSKSKKREEPSGYCELCATHFPNLYEHLHSIEHMDFANNSENFRGIDNAISAFQGMEQDLRQYLQSKVHQASSSVIQSPSLTPGRSDTGPGAPVSRTSDLPPQRVGVGHKDVHSKPVSELFPPPPPLTPIYRLPPEHAANIQPLFSDDDPSMFRQSQDYYDSAGFESSVPPIPREEPNPSTNTHQIRATSDQQRQDVPTTGNTLALPDARGAENEENQNQSSNDFSSSNSVQIGGRFRSCRKCGIAHIPSAVAPDLLQKMSQYIPGRDIDSFCPRAPPDPESDIQTNQNASVDSRPSSRILDGVEPNGKQLGKSINRSPILNDVPVVEEDHLVPIDDRSLNQSPVFEEEERIQKNFNHSILQFLNRMPPSKVFGNSPLLEGCERIDSPADSIHSNESAELRKEDGHSLPITSSHKSSILEDTSETLPMAYEQHRSYVCDEDVPEENEPLEQSNPGERHYPSVLDGQIVPEESEHSSSVQSPQRSPILEDDETASLSRFEKVQPNIEGYHSLLELDNESSLSRFPCLQRPLSPEVASLAGPREHVEEQERRKTRLPRRASLVAREAIGLSMQALFTPTKLTSDRIFEKSHSQSYDKWSVDSSSNNDSCKLILRRVNRKSQTHVESVSSYSSPHARSLPLILQSPQTKSNISASLSSIEETEDDKIDTSKASKSEETCVNTLTDSWNDSKETPRPRSRKSLALRERNGNIFSDDDTTSPTQSNLTRRRTFTHNITDSPSDKENKGDTSTSKGVWRLLTFNSSDTTSAITSDDSDPRKEMRRRRRRRRRTRSYGQNCLVHSPSASPTLKD